MLQGSWFMVQSWELRVQRLEFRVQCSGFRVHGSGFRAPGFGFRVPGPGYTVPGVIMITLPPPGFRFPVPQAAQGQEVMLRSIVYKTTLIRYSRNQPADIVYTDKNKRGRATPLSSKYGTYKTLKARFWPSLPGFSPRNLSGFPLFARDWVGGFIVKQLTIEL